MAGFAEFATGLPAGIGLRATAGSDRTFLGALFASTRTAEMAPVPWPEAQKTAFLQSQFELQDAHYRQHFPAAEHLVITGSAAAIGRIIVDRGAAALHLMDIALVPEQRGHGIGTALVSRLIAWGDGLGVPVTLYVESFNPAQRLYARLGFRAGELQGIHRRMTRPAPSRAR